MNARQKTVLFVMGSGCSRPSGQPMIDEITGACLEDEYYMLGPVDEASLFVQSLPGYFPCWGPRSSLHLFNSDSKIKDFEPWRRPAQSIQKALQKLCNLPIWSHPPNYEDISGLLLRVAGSYRQNENDPLVSEFIKSSNFSNIIGEVQMPQGHEYYDLPFPGKLVFIEDFIGWVIAHQIKTLPKLDGYESLTAALQNLAKRNVKYHFATTNYDCNIERLLRKLSVPFCDGLPKNKTVDDSKRIWRCGNRFDFSDQKCSQILKLHGSINWFLLEEQEGYGRRVIGAANSSVHAAINFRASMSVFDQLTMSPCRSPLMLRGALSKVAEYSYDVHSQLLFNFEKLLEKADVCVVAGFGWGDEGVAARLMRFVRTPRKILVALDGAQDAPAISRNPGFTLLMVRNRDGKIDKRQSLILVRKHMSNISSRELVTILDDAVSASGINS